MAWMVFFCSSRFDLQTLAEAINDRFAGINVVGCTSAGEIGPAGYRSGSLVGASFSTQDGTIASTCIERISTLDEPGARAAVAALHRAIDGRHERSFAFLLTDGLSGCEERTTYLLQRALGEVALVGGSAGDDQCFERTHVFANGEFRQDRAVVTAITTTLPFTVFRSSHFIADSDPLVVTEAIPARRVVTEINGRPALTEYARIIGVSPQEVTAMHFAASPLMVRIDGHDYVRSIQHANPDGSLTLYCAIERGVVLRVARGDDMASSRQRLFDDIRQHIGEPQLTLGFDCIHCQLEAERIDGKRAMGRLFSENRVLGFSTYGEQFVGIHVNQTLTGVALGHRKTR